MRIGQALQHERIYDGKDRGVCPDRKRQREHYGYGETWIAPQLPESIACILPKKLHSDAGAVFLYCLLYLLDAAELRQRAAASLRRGHAGSDLFVRHHIHVCTNLIVELVLNLLLAEEISQGAVDAGPEFHDSLR